jgi:hypothetical protein
MPPCFASRGNNPNTTFNTGVGAESGFIVTALVAVNILGAPEAEAVEGIGGILGALSSFGDAPLVAFSYGSYGGVAGGVAGYLATPPTCP